MPEAPPRSKNEASTLSLSRYAPEAKSAVASAQALADERRHAEVQALHLLVRLFEREPRLHDVLSRAGVNAVELRAAAERALGVLPRSNEPSYLSAGMLDLLERAEREATREREETIRVEHLLNAMTQEIRGPVGELWSAFGITPGSLRPFASVLRGPAPGLSQSSVSTPGQPSEYTRDLLREARESGLAPVIGRDAELRRVLTILERQQKHHPLLVGEPGVGKTAIVRAVAAKLAEGDVPTTLSNARLLELDTGALVAGARLRGEIEERLRKLLQSFAEVREEVILVARHVDQMFGQGATGAAVGDLLRPALERAELRLLATTTPEGVRKLLDRDPAALRLFTTITVNEPSVEQATEIVRGLAGRAEAHHGVEITEGAITSAVRLAKRYVQDRLLPDSALDLLDEAAASRRVASDGFPPELSEAARRQQSLRAQIASLSRGNDPVTRQTRERLQAELDALTPGLTEQRRVLEERRGVIERLRQAKLELDQARAALERAEQAKNYAELGELTHARLPRLEAAREAAEAEARRLGVTPEVERLVREEDVAETLAAWTGIPVARMLEGEAEKLLKMEERLGQRVVGQDHALVAVAKAVRRGRVGLRDPKRPIGSFLFLGPSGVGKTELAKALAEFLFDDEQALTRLDMSEFMERHMAQRLLGAPPGYADSERGGFLTEAVRHRPYSVLLFDEVEKAHQDVFNLLLQVLDDGRLTDGRGRLADFSNTVVIMTSNIGSDRILQADPKLFTTPDGREALGDVLFEQLRSFFRPEFLNRVDETIVFQPLSREHLRRIVDIQLAQLEKLLVERQVRLELTPEAKDRLVELGYEPGLGARPLRRAILKHVQDPVAEAILAQRFAEGTTLRVSRDGDELVLGAAS